MSRIIFGIGALLVMVQGIARDPQTCLWYKRAARKWEEALPVGNGRLGAMVHGGVQKEVIQLNEDSMWSGKPHDWNNPEFHDGLQEVKQLFAKGDYVKAHAVAEKKLICKGDGSHHCNTAQCDYGSYQTLGDLTLTFHHDGDVKSYSRELDLKTAVATVAYEADGIKFCRRVFASFPDQVIVVHLTADKQNALNFDVAISRSENGAVFGKSLLQMSGNLYEGGIDYAAAVQVIPTDGSMETSANGISVRDATDVMVVVVANTTFRTEEPQKQNTKELKRISQKTFDQLQARHTEDYRKLFNRCVLDLPKSHTSKEATADRIWPLRQGGLDPSIFALYFNYGRYLLIASSRGQSLPANLQGIWSDKILTPWCGDFHLNINLQMNYWPAETTNLSECSDPLDAFIFGLEKSGTETASEMYKAKGWVAHHISNIWGFTAPAEHPSWGLFPGGAAWLCRHLWDKYLFSQDITYLKKIYPTLKNASLFFLDTLYKDEHTGYLLPNPSNSPENEYVLTQTKMGYLSKAATVQLSLIRDIFTIVQQSSTILKHDREYSTRLERALAKLYPYKVDHQGLLKEYQEDFELPFPAHRHMSHLYGLFPGYDLEIMETPELLQAAKRSLNDRWEKGFGQTGWNLGWTINLFARLHDKENAFKALVTMLACSTLPNFFDNHPPFQIDGNFGGAAGIAEMLLQSHTDEIVLLPALPTSWKQGSIRGLRARGGLEVSVAWENSNVKTLDLVVIASNHFRIRLPKDHQITQIIINGKIQSVDWKDDEVFELDLEKGDRILAL